ncbi:hypothetical protein [Brevundimonas sp.]|uniref:hypothetical protein n=1 Tax=Brevundimonas sp. TaxID=1871086 RepID=UPI003518BF14
MAHDINPEPYVDGKRDMKPAYQAPFLTELDAGETAVGVVVGSPENISYIS